jgi:hypothetical protein
MGCVGSLLVVRIEAGESRVFIREIEKTEIVGDSLRAGYYHVWSQLDLWPTPVLLYAGAVKMTR